jgi:hypothetical protein
MLHTSLRIDGRIFHLRADQEIDALKGVILEAARGAVRFLDFAAARGTVSVLVTSRTTIEFVESEVAAEDLSEQLPAIAGTATDPFSFL